MERKSCCLVQRVDGSLKGREINDLPQPRLLVRSHDKLRVPRRRGRWQVPVAGHGWLAGWQSIPPVRHVGSGGWSPIMARVLIKLVVSGDGHQVGRREGVERPPPLVLLLLLVVRLLVLPLVLVLVSPHTWIRKYLQETVVLAQTGICVMDLNDN